MCCPAFVVHFAVIKFLDFLYIEFPSRIFDLFKKVKLVLDSCAASHKLLAVEGRCVRRRTSPTRLAVLLWFGPTVSPTITTTVG